MGLADLFRPKWKHSDAEVRASAVRQLGSEEEEILSAVARTDADAAVRRIAIKKLGNPTLLSEISRNDPDESLRQIAFEKSTSILISAAIAEGDPKASEAALAQLAEQNALADVAKTALLESIRRAAVARLTDGKALADVARNAGEPSIRLAALIEVTDPTVLRSVALNDEHKEVALAALEKLEDREGLEIISKKGKLKAVRTRAQKRLRSFKPEESKPSPEDTRRVQWVQICKTVDALAHSSDLEQAAKKIEEARANWETLAADVDEDLRQRFKKSCDDFFDRYARIQEQRRAHAQQDQTRRESLAARTALCEALESTKSASDRTLAEALVAWEKLGPAPEADRSALEHRFQSACEVHRQRFEGEKADEALLAQLERLCGRAEAIAESPQLQEGKQEWTVLQEEWRKLRLDGERAASFQARFAQARRRLQEREDEVKAKREQRKQENRTHLVELCTRLEGLADNDSVKAIERELKEAQAALRKLGALPHREEEEELKQRFHAAREKLSVRVRELRDAEDWKRWANVPKLELCARVESLIEEPDLKEAAQKLKRVQADWKQTGAAPKDKADGLWERFKQAADQVHARCQTHFAKLDEERAENLKSKEALCEKVEALADSTDWNQTAEEIKRLQEEWKKVGPAPKNQADAVWKRFRQPCDRFFERRQQHLEQVDGKRTENLKIKEALCEKVEALADSTDWNQTAEEIKRLQEEWKKIGPVARAQSEVIWKRFRAACDRFFERRQQHQDKERDENLAHKEGICLELEGLVQADPQPATADGAPATDAQAMIQRIKQAQVDWRRIGPVPREQSDAIWARFNRACEKIVELHPQAFKGTDLDPEANLKQKEKLCLAAEALLPEEPLADRPSRSTEDIAEQLRTALAANTFSEKTEASPADWRRDAVEEAKELQNAWKRIGPTPREEGQKLWERFRAACDKVFVRQQEIFAEKEAEREENWQKKIALCEQAEALAKSGRPLDHLETIQSLQQQWKDIGATPRAKGNAIWHRFRRACNQVIKAASAGKKETVEPSPAAEAPHLEDDVSTSPQEGPNSGSDGF